MEYEELSLDYFEIFTDEDNEKYIKLNGSIYKSEDNEYDGDDYDNEAKCYRHVQFVFGVFTVKEFLEDSVSSFYERLKQYGDNITYSEASEIVEDVKSNSKYLDWYKISTDTPDGYYYGTYC